MFEITPAHCPERTLTITTTPPNGVQFSHPLTERARTASPVRRDVPYENLFHEPEFAPTARRRDDVTDLVRRPTRRRTAA